jgi:branched-chain amino acid transport system ATP-binding protein
MAPLSVWENLRLGAWVKSARGQRQASLERVYEIFPALKEKQHELVGGLSGGQQQMVAIGRGLMAQPRLLLLDEPFLGLNASMITAISDALRRINADGVTLLFIDQDVERALALSSHAFVLESGKLVLAGESKQLLESEATWQIYLGAHGVAVD